MQRRRRFRTARQLISPRPDWLLQKTHGTPALPVLKTADGHIIKESLVILQYLEVSYPARPSPSATPATRGERHAAAQRFDLIMTAMTLHHVPDTNHFLRIFHDLLTPGGYLCIADLGRLATTAGFSDIRFQTVFSIAKTLETGTRDYTVFLMTARRTDAMCLFRTGQDADHASS